MNSRPLPEPTAATLDRSTLARPLMDEWRRLDGRGDIAAAARRWCLVGLAPDAGGRDVLRHIGDGRDATADCFDAALAELVGHAANDQLAARVVLQRVLPGLVNVARRRGGSWAFDRTTAFDDVVATAWIVIRQYPLERRPRRVAANIVKDAEYFAFVRPRRMMSGGERSVAAGSMQLPVADQRGRPEDEPVSSFETVVRVLSDARQRGLGGADLDLAAQLVSGRAVGQIASSLGVSTRTVLNRRISLVARLRRLEMAA